MYYRKVTANTPLTYFFKTKMMMVIPLFFSMEKNSAICSLITLSRCFMLASV